MLGTKSYVSWSELDSIHIQGRSTHCHLLPMLRVLPRALKQVGLLQVLPRVVQQVGVGVGSGGNTGSDLRLCLHSGVPNDLLSA